MRPKFFPNNAADCGAAHSKQIPQSSGGVFACGIHGPDFSDLVLGELGRWSIYSFKGDAAIFVGHLVQIVSLGSSSKMVRIATNWIVARMKNVKPIRDIASVAYNPSQSVGHPSHWFFEKLCGIGAVAVLLNPALPRPALVQLSNFYIGRKSRYELLRQELLQHFRRNNFSSHNIQSVDCCDTPSAASYSARAPLFCLS